MLPHFGTRKFASMNQQGTFQVFIPEGQDKTCSVMFLFTLVSMVSGVATGWLSYKVGHYYLVSGVQHTYSLSV